MGCGLLTQFDSHTLPGPDSLRGLCKVTRPLNDDARLQARTPVWAGAGLFLLSYELYVWLWEGFLLSPHWPITRWVTDEPNSYKKGLGRGRDERMCWTHTFWPKRETHHPLSLHPDATLPFHRSCLSSIDPLTAISLPGRYNHIGLDEDEHHFFAANFISLTFSICITSIMKISILLHDCIVLTYHTFLINSTTVRHLCYFSVFFSHLSLLPIIVQ